jgi:hypothetical protein
LFLEGMRELQAVESAPQLGVAGGADSDVVVVEPEVDLVPRLQAKLVA